MKFNMLVILLPMILSACGAVDNMQKITRETKESVDDTKKGQQLSTALEFLHNSHSEDMALPAAAAETVFMLAPDDRIHKYLGVPLPLTIGANPQTSTPNVSMVYLKGEYKEEEDEPLIDPGVSAPKSPRVYGYIEHAALQILQDLAMVASKDLSTEKISEYRGKAAHMIPIATAIFGARSFSNPDVYYRDVEIKKVTTRGKLRTMNSLYFRTSGAKLLRTIAVKYSLPEADVNALRVLMSVRMGIDYNLLN